MGDNFRIYKTDDRDGPRYVDFPKGFSDLADGLTCQTFNEAVAEFIEAALRQCPMCGRDQVVDTATGWSCLSCLSYDTAIVAP